LPCARILSSSQRDGLVQCRADSTCRHQSDQAAGQTLEVRVQVVETRNRDDLEHAFAAMARERIDALLVPADPFLFTERQRVVELAGMYSTREYAEAGGLMSYSARLSEQFRCAAIYVDKILRGASPATLPVEAPSHYELVMNLKTARALGLPRRGWQTPRRRRMSGIETRAQDSPSCPCTSWTRPGSGGAVPRVRRLANKRACSPSLALRGMSPRASIPRARRPGRPRILGDR
jgi:putative ABC transport system substrate-binding protein